MEDPAKKRRAYLSKKATFTILAIVAVLFSVYGGCIGLVVTVLQILYPVGTTEPPFWVWILVLSLMGVGGALGVRSSTKRLKSLPYVPPVHEQLSGLRADEVLLRGSDEPTATPEELLRPAREGAETDYAVVLARW
jgi:hypothetical protein